MSKHEKHWYPLDNAGVLYSAIQKEKYSPIYRFSAIMTELVDPVALQRAVDRTMPRFPTFRVRMKRGLFWNYLENNPNVGPYVCQDISNPCQPVRYKEEGGWLIRFFYYEHRIAFECFHAVSDGAGGLMFFRTILAVYLRELGYDIPNEGGVLDIEQLPRREEGEDAYARYQGRKTVPRTREDTAFANTGTPEPFYTFHMTMGLVSCDQVKNKAKERKVTVTEYLTTVLLWSIMENQKETNPAVEKPVALAIPINLRPWFPSETLRNFILTVRPTFDPGLGDYTFEEVLSVVHHYMRLHVTKQRMQGIITGNVKTQSNRALAAIPNVIKSPWVSRAYRLSGVRPYSGTYTNPGIFTVPPAMEPHMKRMEVVLGQATVPRVHCASISYGNTMAITFGGTLKETDTERRFFRFLVKEGIHVKIESNRCGKEKLEEEGGTHGCPIV